MPKVVHKPATVAVSAAAVGVSAVIVRSVAKAGAIRLRHPTPAERDRLSMQAQQWMQPFHRPLS